MKFMRTMLLGVYEGIIGIYSFRLKRRFGPGCSKAAYRATIPDLGHAGR